MLAAVEWFSNFSIVTLGTQVSGSHGTHGSTFCTMTWTLRVISIRIRLNCIAILSCWFIDFMAIALIKSDILKTALHIFYSSFSLVLVLVLDLFRNQI